MKEAIVLKNVRTHNLKGIDVTIPHRSLVVITGVSGSGKSSLAFDTLYAEGRRRYVESLSSYARQFLERIEKPDVDSVCGILPAIAIEAKNVITNARSTVGTQTELNDYLRLLFARIGKTYCTSCQEQVEPDTSVRIAEKIGAELKGQSLSIAFPLFVGGKTKTFFSQMHEEFERQGFLHFFVSRKPAELSELHKKLTKAVDQILVVVDRLEPSDANRSRFIESLETALGFGRGKVSVVSTAGGVFTERKFSNRFHCARCDRDYREPTPNAFSFNSPLGACPDCQGFGRVITVDWNLVVPNPNLSIEDGAIEPWTKPSAKWEFRQLKNFCANRDIPIKKPFSMLSAQHRKWILEGGVGDEYFSVQDFFDYLQKKTYKMHVRILLSKYRGYVTCSRCGGTRLKPEALAVRVNRKNIAELSAMDLATLREFFESLPLSEHDCAVAKPVLSEIRNRLSFLMEVGLGYLTLDRLSRTLSGGESQRIRLAASLGSALVDTLYVLDEPSVGLHDRDNVLLIRLLKKLKDLGNTVVVVEHDRTMIKAADEVIDLGPLGGEQGGKVVFSGPFSSLLSVRDSHTARYFRGELAIQRNGGKGAGCFTFEEAIHVHKASEHNLKGISVKIPLHCFTVVTGVSGSGKSTLMYDVLYANYLRWLGRSVQEVGAVERIDGWDGVDDVLLIDQSPIGRTPRSNPVTYVKAFDPIRKLFSSTSDARKRKLSAGYFSFNVPGGRCDQCQGEGVQKIEMHFLADLYVTCEACSGTRYQAQVLDVRYRGKNIREVLDLTVDEALEFFKDQPKATDPLSVVAQVGLGHLRLGQSATTLSGGEAQRLKLASELVHGRQHDGRPQGAPLLYLFDEPTTGLHYYDIASLLSAFETLLARGHAICVIEHNLEVIKCADYVIDLGPEGGDQGGRVVYEGPLQGILKVEESHTGAALKRYLNESVMTAGAGSKK
ncbi:MAG: excinuclease ABC subunit A [Omnitrophica bacterium RIFCSPLOWO2_12_FULL_50_11]|nr:MAG: excinuclease ABC subunit A [Omnitrophica bacterium RIFCSPLOWO2_12_FULL_50_11]